MLIIMFPVSMLWFDLINFEYKFLGSLAAIILLTVTLLFKLPKLREGIKNRYQG